MEIAQEFGVEHVEALQRTTSVSFLQTQSDRGQPEDFRDTKKVSCRIRSIGGRAYTNQAIRITEAQRSKKANTCREFSSH